MPSQYTAANNWAIDAPLNDPASSAIAAVQTRVNSNFAKAFQTVTTPAALGTAYQNNSGHNLDLSVRALVTSAANSLSISVAPTTGATAFVVAGGTGPVAAGTGYVESLNFSVPAGWIYTVNGAGVTGIGNPTGATGVNVVAVG